MRSFVWKEWKQASTNGWPRKNTLRCVNNDSREIISNFYILKNFLLKNKNHRWNEHHRAMTTLRWLPICWLMINNFFGLRGNHANAIARFGLWKRYHWGVKTKLRSCCLRSRKLLRPAAISTLKTTNLQILRIHFIIIHFNI